MSLLEAKSLTVEYGGARVLTDATFEVHEGEIVSLLGPNGAGKSTALRGVGGLLQFYDGKLKSGRVTFNGRDITDLGPVDLYEQGVVTVPEGRHVFRRMTVQENIEMGARNDLSARQRRNDVEETFAIFPHMAERRTQSAGSLSTGEQQMLALARALISHPPLLLADEPSAGLAPTMVEALFDLLRRLRDSGVSILLAEQNVFSALDASDRAYLFESGRLVRHGNAADLAKTDSIRELFMGRSSITGS